MMAGKCILNLLEVYIISRIAESISFSFPLSNPVEF